ncbi:MAG: hypothetical protein ACRYGL_09700, partial [Janthinobacterium lividum]
MATSAKRRSIDLLPNRATARSKLIRTFVSKNPVDLIIHYFAIQITAMVALKKHPDCALPHKVPVRKPFWYDEFPNHTVEAILGIHSVRMWKGISPVLAALV